MMLEDLLTYKLSKKESVRNLGRSHLKVLDSMPSSKVPFISRCYM